ncbi:MAG: SDR family NAD(P)-dependent oxidoreductase [Pseudomonadota bacterium]
MGKRLRIDGAVVLITGAGQGIGLELVKQTLERGGTPVAVECDSDTIDALKKIVGDKGDVYQTDVTDRAAMEAVVITTCERRGGVDIVIANAGIERIDPIQDMDPRTFETVIETNLLGVYRTLKPALNSVIKRNGHIVAVSSVSALVPFPMATAYSTSKAGVSMLMRALRMEMNGTGATAGVCYFGFVDTEMVDRIFSKKLLVRALDRFHAPLLGTRPRISAHTAAKQVLDGIEKRKAKVYAPSMVRLTHAMQGIYALLDDAAAKHTMRRGNLIHQHRMEKRAREPK